MRPDLGVKAGVMALAMLLGQGAARALFDDSSKTPAGGADSPNAAPEEAATLVNKLDNSMHQRAALSRFRQYVSPQALDQATLGQMVAAASEGTGLEIHVDWAALQARGLKRDTALRVEGRALSYEGYLAAACAQAGVTLVLYFKEPDGLFTLTTREGYGGSEPLPAPALKAGHGQPAVVNVNVFYTPVERAVLAQLEANLREISADQQPFEKVLAFLESQSQAHFLVNWKALQEAGIDRNAPVSVDLRDLPVGRALTAVLSEVGGGGGYVGFTVDGGAVIISTREDLNGERYQRVHEFDIRTLSACGQENHEERVREIIGTIMMVVAPDTWRDNGGPFGSMREQNGQLIVTQTRENQVAIAHLLNDMTAGKSEASTPKAGPTAHAEKDLDGLLPAADRAALARLEKNVQQISAQQQGFEKVIAFLRQSSQANFFANWTALQAAGVDRNTPVSVNLRELPARKVLNIVLSKAGGGAANLGYTVDGGVIVISTKDDLNSLKYEAVHVFDIRNLLTTRPRSRDEQVRDIIDTIRMVVAPDSWRDAGGMIGSMREFNGQLIVTQTRDNQAAIAHLLKAMAATKRTESGPHLGQAEAAIADLSPLPTAADRTTRARLEMNIRELSPKEQGFEKVIAFLQNNIQANMVINWPALQAAGIDRNTPVSVNLRDVPARKALTTVLSEVGGGAANLGYTMDEGVIVISTKDDLNSAKYQTVMMFDVRELETYGPGSRDDRIRNIVEWTKSVVAPDSWRDNGGTIGSIREWNGNLIVTQTRDNQAAIPDLLKTATARMRELNTPRVLRGDYMEADLNQLCPAADRATMARLGTRIGEISVKDQALEKVLTLVQQSSGANLSVNWTALQAAGIGRDTPVSVNLQDLPAGSVLATVLAEVGGETAPLGYTVDGGAVVVSTRDDLTSAKYQIVHSFDISVLAEIGRTGYDERVKDLIDKIKTTVAPDTWRDAGGTVGWIREWQGYLVVSQTRDNEVTIALMLKEMAARRRAGSPILVGK